MTLSPRQSSRRGYLVAARAECGCLRVELRALAGMGGQLVVSDGNDAGLLAVMDWRPDWLDEFQAGQTELLEDERDLANYSCTGSYLGDRSAYTVTLSRRESPLAITLALLEQFAQALDSNDFPRM